MADFSFVTERLATGAAIGSADDVQQLIAAGITHVVDCRAEFDDGQLLASSGLHYLWNPTQDDGQHKLPEWFGTSLSFALPAIPVAGAKVYAHCAAGVNRGPSTALAILMAYGLSPDLAEQLIRTARPQVGLAYKADAIAAVSALGYV